MDFVSKNLRDSPVTTTMQPTSVKNITFVDSICPNVLTIFY